MRRRLFCLLSIAVIACTYIGCNKSGSVPAPVINSISPVSGVAGNSVTISGSNFDPTMAGNMVSFNGMSATVNSASATSLVVTVPAGGSSGNVSVTNSAGTAKGPVFSYLQPPTVTGINPASGRANTLVTITGANFKTTASSNTVKFNGTQATVQSATATTLTVLAPSGGTTGAVSVTTTDGTAAGATFTYLPIPVITSVSPNSASAGSTVTLTGTNFDAVKANDTVRFNNATATITSATATQLVVTVPSGTSGNIIVSTGGGVSNGVPFTYVTGPTIYVMGSDTRTGYGYWINSSFNPLADCSTTYCIKGSGSDIYIAGPSTSNTPTYWKNGTAVHLSSQTGYTYAIFIDGTDIYCQGILNGVYCVWKNGVATTLTTTGYITTANQGYYLNNNLFVYNGDTYSAAGQYISGGFISKATYWKNGSPVDLTNMSAGNAIASAIYVSGGDVYVAGIEQETGSGGGIVNTAPRLWKNGVSIPLTTPGQSLFNSVSSLLVVGSDVYVGGQYNGAGAVWKNGTMINTSTYALAENVSSLFLYNNTDLYATGASSSSGNNCYWKNGNFVEMDPGCSGLSASCANTSSNQSSGIYVK